MPYIDRCSEGVGAVVRLALTFLCVAIILGCSSRTSSLGNTSRSFVVSHVGPDPAFYFGEQSTSWQITVRRSGAYEFISANKALQSGCVAYQELFHTFAGALASRYKNNASGDNIIRVDVYGGDGITTFSSPDSEKNDLTFFASHLFNTVELDQAHRANKTSRLLGDFSKLRSLNLTDRSGTMVVGTEINSNGIAKIFVREKVAIHAISLPIDWRKVQLILISSGVAADVSLDSRRFPIYSPTTLTLQFEGSAFSLRTSSATLHPCSLNNIERGIAVLLLSEHKQSALPVDIGDDLRAKISSKTCH